MKPKVSINGHDYTKYVSELKPSVNDVDAEGSGRDTLDGKMWRSRVARKDKWTLTFLRLTAAVLKQLHADLDAEFVHVTMLDPATNTHKEKEYYCATLNYGVQRYAGDETVYDGVTFNLTER